MNVNGKKVLVVGMARSGIAAAELLLNEGAIVLINDTKTAEAFGDALDSLKNQGAQFHLGVDPVSLLNGVDTVIVSPGVPLKSAIYEKAIASDKRIIGELELAYRLSRGKVIAITGTNGKTTTTTLVGEIFKNAGKVTHVVGNIGFPYSAIAKQSRPEDVVVVEVSSFQLESIQSFHPSVSAVLNITEDHLNRHGTMEEYIRLKKRIFENQNQDEFTVLNYDDEVVRSFASLASCKVVFFSRLHKVPFGAWVENGNIVFGSDHPKTICSIEEVRIPGPHNLENALAASAMAICAGVPIPVVRHTLRTFGGVEHRLEPVKELFGVQFINDTKGTNVDSVLKAIESMTKPTVIILGGSNKQVDFTSLAHKMVGSNVKKAVLIGETASQFEDTLKKAGYLDFVRASTFEQAIDIAYDSADDGWNVLLSPACASFDMFHNAEHRGDEFKRIVNQLNRRRN